MSKKDFDKFINQQVKEDTEKKQIDWEAKRDEWLSYLNIFYNKIEQFLAEYVDSGKINYEYSEKKINEEYIGEYSAKVLTIQLGRYHIKLEPIGTNLVGANGRVDLIGANGKVRFVLVDKTSSAPKINVLMHGKKPLERREEKTKIEWDWKIATPPPRIQYINLEQDTFLNALMEVVGG